MDRKLLATGGAGFLGSHSCATFIDAGDIPIFPDNLCNSSGSVVERLEEATGMRPGFIEYDVRDRTNMVDSSLYPYPSDLRNG